MPSLDDEASAWLARLRGAPSAIDRTEFHGWYRADPRHAQAFDKAQAAFDAANGRAAPGDAARTRAALIGHRSPPARRYAMAATVAVMLLVTGLLMHGGWPFKKRGEMAIMLSTGVGEIRTERLADGSAITLDTRTRAQVLLGSTERRIILLQGRARFAPAPDPARRFVVVARTEEIEARGTLFDVALTDDEVDVALLEGSAMIRPVTAAGGADGVRALSAGQRLISSPTGQSLSVPVSPEELRWVSGVLSFEDVPLEVVVTAANRYSNRQIRLTDTRTRALRFTGTFKARDTDNFAAMLAAMFHLRLRHGPRGDVLLDIGQTTPLK